jgi:hypothetical protein
MWSIRFSDEFLEMNGRNGVWFIEDAYSDSQFVAFSEEDAQYLCDLLNEPR